MIIPKGPKCTKSNILPTNNTVLIPNRVKALLDKENYFAKILRVENIKGRMISMDFIAPNECHILIITDTQK